VTSSNKIQEFTGHFKHLIGKLQIALATVEKLYDQLPPQLLQVADRISKSLEAGMRVAIPLPAGRPVAPEPDHPPEPSAAAKTAQTSQPKPDTPHYHRHQDAPQDKLDNQEPPLTQSDHPQDQNSRTSPSSPGTSEASGIPDTCS